MTDKTTNGMRLVATIASCAIGMAGVLYWFGTDRATLASEVNQNTVDILDHETRIRDVERMATDIAEIKTDINWLRTDAEKDK